MSLAWPGRGTPRETPEGILLWAMVTHMCDDRPTVLDGSSQLHTGLVHAAKPLALHIHERCLMYAYDNNNHMDP